MGKLDSNSYKQMKHPRILVDHQPNSDVNQPGSRDSGVQVISFDDDIDDVSPQDNHNITGFPAKIQSSDPLVEASDQRRTQTQPGTANNLQQLERSRASRD